MKIDRMKPGTLQAHWPEINMLVPAGRLDASGVPDYNTTVEVASVGAGVRRGGADCNRLEKLFVLRRWLRLSRLLK